MSSQTKTSVRRAVSPSVVSSPPRQTRRLTLSSRGQTSPNTTKRELDQLGEELLQKILSFEAKTKPPAKKAKAVAPKKTTTRARKVSKVTKPKGAAKTKVAKPKTTPKAAQSKTPSPPPTAKGRGARQVRSRTPSPAVAEVKPQPARRGRPKAVKA